MARTHHRKKHKEHLRQFKQDHENASSSSAIKGKSTKLFTIIGAITGIAISYFAAGAAIVWLAIGLVIGGIIGYYIGYKIDTDK